MLITAYDREELFRLAIESAVASTFTDIEIIVLDNGSSDGTQEVAREFAARDSRVRFFRNEKNVGDYPARNQIAGMATGEYLKYLDSDDLIYPHGIGAFVAAMDSFPEAGFGLSEAPEDDRPYPIHLSPIESYREHFFDRDVFGRAPGSAIIRRAAFESAGGFRLSDGRAPIADLEFWLRLARRFGVVKLQRDLLWDRQHGGQGVAQLTRTHLTWAQAAHELHREALSSSDCPLSLDERQLALRRLDENDAREALRLGVAKGELRQAYRYLRGMSVPLSAVFRTVANRGRIKDGI